MNSVDNQDNLYSFNSGLNLKEEATKELKLIRVIDEKRLEKERENRVLQAFTFGIKLKNGLPDRYKLFESLSKVNRTRKSLGLSRKQSLQMMNTAIMAERIFDKYHSTQNFQVKELAKPS